MEVKAVTGVGEANRFEGLRVGKYLGPGSLENVVATNQGNNG